MQRARRLALVAVLPLLGVLALAGCRSEPGIAAYAGGNKYTIEQVDALAAEVKGRVPEYGSVRQMVLTWLILRDLGAAELERRNVKPEPADVAAVEAQLGLEKGSPLAKLANDFQAVFDGLGSSVTAVEPTEAEQREVYSHLNAGGAQIPPFEQVRSVLDKDAIGRAIGVQRDMKALLAAGKVQVNPRYAPLDFQIGVRLQNGATSHVVVPFTGADRLAVTEASGAA